MSEKSDFEFGVRDLRAAAYASIFFCFESERRDAAQIHVEATCNAFFFIQHSDQIEIQHNLLGFRLKSVSGPFKLFSLQTAAEFWVGPLFILLDRKSVV